jgi:rhodanese-related sulfurtransferase
MKHDRRAPIASLAVIAAPAGAAALILAAVLNLAAVLILTAAPGYCFSISGLLGNSDEQNLETFKLIHIGDLKSLMDTSKSGLHLYDANDDSTRNSYGVIPGANLLDSDDHYNLAVLPPDKDATLVFYCANTH